MPVTICLTQNQHTLVDEADVALLSRVKWQAVRTKYNWYVVSARGEGQPPLYMHRLLTNAGIGQYVDHADRNTLNNCRSNLRLCSQSLNMGNMTKPIRRAGNTSQFKGVSWVRDRNKWFAAITINGKMMYLGRYVSEDEAARAYDRAALHYFGGFARLNFSQHQAS